MFYRCSRKLCIDAPVKLNDIQTRLERTYDVSTPHRAEDFLLLDAKLANELTAGSDCRDCPERLLIAQSDEGVDVSLYLDRAILTRLSSHDPTEALHGGNLQDFLYALEGVSHFLYLTWNTRFKRRITLLELELQAEVDKFVTTAALIVQQRCRDALQPLWQALFENFRFRSDLGALERQRYHEANRLAAHYCDALRRRFHLMPGDAALAGELRRFYRMPQGQKIRHIQDGLRASAI